MRSRLDKMRRNHVSVDFDFILFALMTFIYSNKKSPSSSVVGGGRLYISGDESQSFIVLYHIRPLSSLTTKVTT